MVTRGELVRGFVLNTICEDYFNLAEIADCVAEDAARCGMEIGRGEIEKALGELVEADQARAYRLTSNNRPPEEYVGMPQGREIEERFVYFWITPKGAEQQSAECEWWPFDENDELRKDWTAPAE